MNKWEIEVQQSLLDSEEAAIKELEKQYAMALADINQKVKLFQADIDLLDQALSQDGLDDATKALLQSRKRSKIYQQQYQKALQGQISSILDKMHGDNYATIDKYLHSCYETGYIGTMYDIAKQGIPVIVPIDQAAAVKAILTDSKVSGGLYNRLGVDVGKLKKTITQEISRGIATGMGYGDIARNIRNVSGAPMSRTKTIARTEGHRIQQTSAVNAQQKAKAKGADVLKQWDASLDGRTRDSHRQVDGEIKELDEKFSNGLMFPGDPNGGAAEVVNCRCTSNTRARWALDESELETLKQRAEYFGLDKTKDFEDYKKKYLPASEQITFQQEGEKASPPKEYDGVFDDFEELNLAKEEKTALVQLQSLANSDGNEHGTVIANGKITAYVSSGLPDAVKISVDGLGDGLTVLHSHTNATPPSATDFRRLLDRRIEKIGVIGYNGDVFMAYIGDGIVPEINEFDDVVKSIANEVNMSMIDDPNFYDWTIPEKNYMAIREQAYRIARHFEWTLEGGRIDE